MPSADAMQLAANAAVPCGECGDNLHGERQEAGRCVLHSTNVFIHELNKRLNTTVPLLTPVYFDTWIRENGHDPDQTGPDKFGIFVNGMKYINKIFFSQRVSFVRFVFATYEELLEAHKVHAGICVSGPGKDLVGLYYGNRYAGAGSVSGIKCDHSFFVKIFTEEEKQRVCVFDSLVPGIVREIVPRGHINASMKAKTCPLVFDEYFDSTSAAVKGSIIALVTQDFYEAVSRAQRENAKNFDVDADTIDLGSDDEISLDSFQPNFFAKLVDTLLAETAAAPQEGFSSFERAAREQFKNLNKK